jgi:symplekin
MARDPERVGLAIAVIHYLVLFRPPVRDICLDALEDLWKNCRLTRYYLLFCALLIKE